MIKLLLNFCVDHSPASFFIVLIDSLITITLIESLILHFDTPRLNLMSLGVRSLRITDGADKVVLSLILLRPLFN